MICQAGSIVIGAILATELLRLSHRQRGHELVFLAFGIVTVLLTGVHDWLIQSAILAPWWDYGSHLLPYSAPLLIAFIGWHLTGRFIRALSESEALNAELESRVDDARRQLEDNYRQLHELEKHQAINDERDRIYRDLHDDVGAKLVSLMFRAGDTPNAELARAALRDLREIVSHSKAEERPLSDAIADWRAECNERLDEAGIRLDWRQPGPLPELTLSPQQTLHLGRTLREALNNVLHHARADAICVEIRCQDGSLHCSVVNNGITRMPSAHPGRGKSNMCRRIEELGGRIAWRIEPDSLQHQVSWEIPLHASPGPVL